MRRGPTVHSYQQKGVRPVEVYTDRDEAKRGAYNAWTERVGEVMETAPSIEAAIVAALGMLIWTKHKAHDVVSEQKGERRCNCKHVWGSMFGAKMAAAMAGNEAPLQIEEAQNMILDIGMAMAMASPDEMVAEIINDLGFLPPSAFIGGAMQPLVEIEREDEFQAMLMDTRNGIQMRASFMETMADFGIDTTEVESGPEWPA